MSSIFDAYLGLIEDKIKDALINGYKHQTNLLIIHLDEAGFNTSHLQDKDTLFNTVSKFLGLCRKDDLNQLYKYFEKLYKDNRGLPALKEAKEILEKAKNEQCKVSSTSPPNKSINKQSNDFIEWKNTEGFYESPLQKEEKKDDSSSVISDNSNHIIDPKIYEELENYLANEQWKEADLETMNLMIEIADSMESSNQFSEDRDVITWLDGEDIKKIPDEALKTIDQLWVKYSEGHFGFSVQAKIWLECRGKPGEFNFTIYQNKFAKQIGWSDGRNWIEKYDNFNFSMDAKRGHLPSLSFPTQEKQEIKWRRWQRIFEYFFPRLFTCGLTL